MKTALNQKSCQQQDLRGKNESLIFFIVFCSNEKYYKRDHSFRTCAKFSEKLTFLSPWYANVRVRIRGWKMLTFWKIFSDVPSEWFQAMNQVHQAYQVYHKGAMIRENIM